VLALVVWWVGRRRWPSWRTGLAVIAVGWLTTISAAGAIAVLAGPDADGIRIVGRIALAGIVLTTVAAIVVARRPDRARPLAAHPPPVPPPGQFPPPPPRRR